MALYYEESPRRQPQRVSSWTVIAPIAFVVAAVAFALWVTGAFRNRTPDLDTNAAPRAVAPKLGPDAMEAERITLFKEVKGSVVNVDTLIIQRDNFDVVERQYGTGSGFIWNDQGHIVTNFHVIRSALARRPQVEVRVTLADRTPWNARIIGVSPENDLAVLKIDAPASQLKPIRVGTSADLEVGQTCYAIGNPFGQSLTLTQGIISAVEREIQSEVTDRPIHGAIQTDAALNPGNSGGPLLDRSGRLIGVNTAIASPSGGNAGIGFAIPVDTVQRIVPELLRNGRVAKPVLGIVALPDRYTRSAGIEKGIMIQQVRPNGPAAKAGLLGIRINRANGDAEPGDLILSIDGVAVNSNSDLDRAMSKHKVGDEVRLTIQRGAKVFETTVTLEGV